MNSALANGAAPRLPGVPRRLAARTRGAAHGGIVRLASPSDLGELIKPFVFLDAFDVDPATVPRFGWHPHSGIATVTVILEGTIGFAETTGRQGTLGAGGVEYMRAAGGVWHSGSMEGDRRVAGFQLWIALGPELETRPPESYYLNDEEVPAKQLSGLGLAYLHVVDYSSFGFPPISAELMSLLRESFGGTFIRAGGLDRSSAERELASERADLIAFGRAFLANPDLVKRLRANAALNAPDMATFYTSGAKGYTDYPRMTLKPSLTSEERAA